MPYLRRLRRAPARDRIAAWDFRTHPPTRDTATGHMPPAAPVDMGGQNWCVAFAHPEYPLAVAVYWNGRPDADAHAERQSTLLGAVYKDLGTCSGTRVGLGHVPSVGVASDGDPSRLKTPRTCWRLATRRLKSAMNSWQLLL